MRVMLRSYGVSGWRGMEHQILCLNSVQHQALCLLPAQDYPFYS